MNGMNKKKDGTRGPTTDYARRGIEDGDCMYTVTWHGMWESRKITIASR